MLNALTVDVEDWAQSTLDHDMPIHESVAANTDAMLSIFEEAGVRCTCFVLGLVAEKLPQVVRRIADAGHEVATHGWDHRLVFELSPEEFRRDLLRSIEAIEGACGRKVRGFRAPDFSVTRSSLWALDIVKDAGLSYDSSIFPIEHPRYGIADWPRRPGRIDSGPGEGLLELPLSAVRVGPRTLPAAGGGYLRIFPYAYNAWAIRRINAEGLPAVVYLHPYELDAGEIARYGPKVPFSLRLSQGTGRRSVARKLRKLVRQFQFGPAEAVLGLDPEGRP